MRKISSICAFSAALALLLGFETGARANTPKNMKMRDLEPYSVSKPPLVLANAWLAGLRTVGLSDLDARKCGPIESRDLDLYTLLPSLNADATTSNEISDQLSELVIMKTIANVLDREACRMGVTTTSNPMQLESAVTELLSQVRPTESEADVMNFMTVKIPMVLFKGKNYRYEVFESFAQLTAKRLKITPEKYARFKKLFERDLRKWVLSGFAPTSKTRSLRFLAQDEVPDEIVAYYRGTLEPSPQWKKYVEVKVALEKRRDEIVARDPEHNPKLVLNTTVDLKDDEGNVSAAVVQFDELPEYFSEFKQGLKERLDRVVRSDARNRILNTITINHWRNASLLDKKGRIDPSHPSMFIFTTLELKRAYHDLIVEKLAAIQTIEPDTTIEDLKMPEFEAAMKNVALKQAIEDRAKARKPFEKRMVALASILKSPVVAQQGKEEYFNEEDTDDLTSLAPNPFAARRYRVVMNKDAFKVRGMDVRLNDTLEFPNLWLQEVFVSVASTTLDDALSL